MHSKLKKLVSMLTGTAMLAASIQFTAFADNAVISENEGKALFCNNQISSEMKTWSFSETASSSDVTALPATYSSDPRVTVELLMSDYGIDEAFRAEVAKVEFDITGYFNGQVTNEGGVQWGGETVDALNEKFADLSGIGDKFTFYSYWGEQTVNALSFYDAEGSLIGTLDSSGFTDKRTPSSVSVTEVSLNKTTLELEEGKEETLVATVLPEGATNKEVEWKSDNTDVATVDEYGKVTAVKAGAAKITVTTKDGGYTDECAVTVTASSSDVTALPATYSSEPRVTVELLMSDYGIDEAFRAEVAKVEFDITGYFNGQVTNEGGVQWGGETVDALNEKFADLSGIGDKFTFYSYWGEQTVNALSFYDAEGSLIGTLDSSGFTDKRTPSSVSVTEVSLNKTTLELEEGKEETLVATVLPEGATNKEVEWKSDNTDVATVDEYGKVTAVKAGAAKITVTTKDGGYTDECAVTVTKGEEPQEPDQGNYLIIAGNNQTWANGSNIGIEITSNGECAEFNYITVDGAIVSAANYSVREGSTIVTLTPGYLSTLPNGRHSLIFYFDNGRSDAAYFTVTGNKADGPNFQALKPYILTDTIGNGAVGTAYSETLLAEGAVGIEWNVSSGELPDGITLAVDGTLSGTPAAGGTYTFTVRASNAFGIDERTYTVEIEDNGEEIEVEEPVEEKPDEEEEVTVEDESTTTEEPAEENPQTGAAIALLPAIAAAAVAVLRRR